MSEKNESPNDESSNNSASGDNFLTANDMPNGLFSMNYINTNARSLRPKITSLVDAFNDLDLTFSVITETWFSDGSKLERESEDLLLGKGLNAVTLNRPPGNAGYSHGGVAVIYRDSLAKAAPFSFPNPEKFEVLPVVLTVKGIKRKLVIIAAYLPPGYTVPRGKACIQHVKDLILHIKEKFSEPYIGLFGDFNQWKVEEAVEDYVDMSEQVGGNTRKDRVIDRNFCNWNVMSTTIRAPLETEAVEPGTARKSDHNVVFMEASIQKIDPPNWQTFKFRQFSEEKAGEFKMWLESQDWRDVLLASGSNAKARAFQYILDEAMDFYFPFKTCRRKQGDLPWFNETARKKVKKKKAVYRDENRSPRWKAVQEDLEKYLAARREKFLSKQRKNLSSPEGSREFHRNVRNFSSYEKPPTFDIRALKPNMSDKDLAEDVATFFNQISQEFEPLDPFSIPRTYERQLPRLVPSQVAEKLRLCKKPASMVEGDIFPKLVTTCSDSLAIPLSDIYNTITATNVWPIAWKKEIVTIIPKKSIPTSYADLRNISCTKLFSKIYEGYLLTWAMEEITLKTNQFGGVKGCSTSHMLLNIWQEIFDNCEDYRSGTVVSAIDYAKAFNRVSFQHCLRALKKKGASSAIIRLVATFLTNRSMSVKIGSTMSDPKPVNGGCPQGSVLGVFLFNVTTDDLEDEFLGQDVPETPFSPQYRVEQNRNFSASSPTGEAAPPDFDTSPIGGGRYRVRDMEVVFERGTRNVPRIDYSDEGMTTPPPEQKTGTQVLQDKKVLVAKYVDDNVMVEKVNYGRTAIENIGGEQVKVRCAPKTQNGFRSISSRAEDKGMVVNSLKTQLLVVSDALNYTPRAYILDRDQNRIDCKDSMKVLGFTFGKKPTMHLHVDTIVKKIRRNYWKLRLLKKFGFNEEELVKTYKSHILPGADYLDVVYHSSLTDEMDERLEQAQVGALRAIFGYKLSARKLREKAVVTTLRNRRVAHCDKFAAKCVTSPRFSHWFPLREARTGRTGEKYLEYYARCDRLKNSPIFFMRRRLNGKVGKDYGERNRAFRET